MYDFVLSHSKLTSLLDTSSTLLASWPHRTVHFATFDGHLQITWGSHPNNADPDSAGLGAGLRFCISTRALR